MSRTCIEAIHREDAVARRRDRSAPIAAALILLVGVSRPEVARADAEPLDAGPPSASEGWHEATASQPTWRRDPGLPSEVARPARGETEQARNVVFFEFGGLGILYSVNYERLVGLSAAPSTDLGLRVGFAALPGYASVPVTASLLHWSGSHALEVGLGCLWSSMFDIGFAGAGVLGYRYGSPRGGPMVRLAYLPLVGGGVARNGIGHWGGFAVGGMF